MQRFHICKKIFKHLKKNQRAAFTIQKWQCVIRWKTNLCSWNSFLPLKMIKNQEISENLKDIHVRLFLFGVHIVLLFRKCITFLLLTMTHLFAAKRILNIKLNKTKFIWSNVLKGKSLNITTKIWPLMLHTKNMPLGPRCGGRINYSTSALVPSVKHSPPYIITIHFFNWHWQITRLRTTPNPLKHQTLPYQYV